MDSDGQFLLVEAANVLPRWLNPEVADNRVWIQYPQLEVSDTNTRTFKVWLHDGNLIIIRPLSSGGSSSNSRATTQSLSIQEAFDVITNNPESLLHSPSIEAEAFYRLRNYPDQIKDNLHRAVISIPRKLAFILKLKPEFISPAVEAFYLRDPIALRPWQKKTSDQSQLTFPPQDLVLVSITFSKVAYAQLRSQRFRPPLGWIELLDKEKDRDGLNQLEIGMKVTCGFEMLTLDPQNKEKDCVVQIRRLLHSLQAEELKEPSNDDIARWEKTQDDESWLDVNFEDFEKELSGSSKSANGRDTAFGDKTAQENLRRIVERFEDFLNDETAGAEGVDSADEDDDEDEDEDEENDMDTEGEDKDVSFDEKEFARMMREMMGLPPDGEDKEIGTSAAKGKQVSRFEGVESGSEDSDSGEIQEIMQRMEVELNAAGALDLDPTPKKLTAVQKAIQGSSKDKSNSLPSGKAEAVDDTDEEVDIDTNLAKNLLESFKSQAGLPGPGGNLLGSLGLKLPRDEDDDIDHK